MLNSEKMSNSIENKIFYIFIILQPILDLLTSLMSRNIEFPLTIGIVVRSIFMAYIFIYALVVYRPKEKIFKYSRLILMSIAIYIVIFMVHSIMNKPISYMITEAKGIIKLFYFPIVMTGLFVFNHKNKIKISNEFLTYLLLAYTGTIFVASITGTYFRSYNEYLYGLGTIGWFFAANEIGAIVAILAPFTIVNIIQNKLNVINTIATVLCIWCVLYIGTKVPFLGFIGVLGLLFIYTIIVAIVGKIKKQGDLLNYKKIFLSIVGVSLISCFLFYQSPIYKNILFNYGHIIQKVTDAFKKDKEGMVNDVAGNKPVTTPENEQEQKQEEEKLEINMHINQDDLVGSLLSNRSAFANESKNIYKSSDLATKLIGLGHVFEIKDGVYTDKTIEMDHLDIVLRHGIIGGILYFAQLIIILGLILRNIIQNPKSLLNMNVIICSISAFLGIGIAFVSGHVLTAPGVSIFIILSVLMLYNEVDNERNLI